MPNSTKTTLSPRQLELIRQLAAKARRNRNRVTDGTLVTREVPAKRKTKLPGPITRGNLNATFGGRWGVSPRAARNIVGMIYDGPDQRTNKPPVGTVVAEAETLERLEQLRRLRNGAAAPLTTSTRYGVLLK